MGGAERMGYEARGARCEVRVRGALLPILLEQIISGGALEREQRAALAARCAASLSLSRWWWGGQSHSAGSQVRSHSHLLLGRPTYPVLDYRPSRPAPAPSEPRAPPAACCPPAPSSRHYCHRAGFRSTSPRGAPQRPFPWDITLGLASDTPRRRPLKYGEWVWLSCGVVEAARKASR